MYLLLTVNLNSKLGFILANLMQNDNILFYVKSIIS
jgi:hypothetical protein